MYRKLMAVASLGLATGLVLATGCSQTPTAPASATSAPGGVAATGADGSTLKVGAPTPVSPVNSEVIAGRRPTMIVKNSAVRYVEGKFSYQFELLTDGGTSVGSSTAAGGNGTTAYAYPTDLDRETPYKWRARAVLDGTYGPWSATSRFITAKEKRTAPGQVVTARPTWGASIVLALGAQRPDLLARSCQDAGGTWEWLDAVVDALRAEDTRFGYNGKRGNPNDPSKDVISYNWGSGPDEGSKQVYLFDTVNGHCGPAPSATWADVTDVTYNSGTTGLWISRGRFPGWTP